MARVHKYEADLSNGKTMRISGTASESEAQRVAEREIREHPDRHGEATTVENVRLTARGRWG